MKSIDEGFVPSEVEHLTNKDLANEFVLTTLRTKWGCDLTKLHELFNYNLIQAQDIKVEMLINGGQLYIENNHLFLTRKGKFIADTIISDLFWI